MHDIRTFMEWLSYHPTSDEIARALIIDYLAPSEHAVLDSGVCTPMIHLSFLVSTDLMPVRPSRHF